MVEGAVELLLEARLGSIHEFDGTAGVAGAAVGKSGAGGRGEIGRFRVQSILVVDDGGFEVGHADETPAGRCHGVDQGGFGGRGGVVFGIERFDEGLEARGTFALEDEAFGEKVVAGGVARDYGFSGWRLSSGGFSGVGSVGRDLFFCRHLLLGISFDGHIVRHAEGEIAPICCKALNTLRRFWNFSCERKSSLHLCGGKRGGKGGTIGRKLERKGVARNRKLYVQSASRAFFGGDLELGAGVYEEA